MTQQPEEWEKDLMKVIANCWLDKGDKEVFNTTLLLEFLSRHKAQWEAEARRQALEEAINELDKKSWGHYDPVGVIQSLQQRSGKEIKE